MRTNFGMMVECFESLRYRTLKNLEVNSLNINVGEAEALMSVLDDALELCYTHKCWSESLMYDYSKNMLEHIDVYKEKCDFIYSKYDLYISWLKVLEVSNAFIKGRK